MQRQSTLAEQNRHPIRRCCPEHRDWPTLAMHVATAFPDVPVGQIARELHVARQAVTTFDLGGEALQVAELIARHRLMVAAGLRDDEARLDPQPHPRRRAKHTS